MLMHDSKNHDLCRIDLIQKCVRKTPDDPPPNRACYDGRGLGMVFDAFYDRLISSRNSNPRFGTWDS